MRTYDFAPLFRSTIGFDRLFDLAETAQRGVEESYPPYNIERLAEDRYQITLAVAGFSPDEISITAEQNVVSIEGGKAEKAEREFLYRGISTRHFKRQFNLADYVQCQSAFKFDPASASNFDPFERRVLTVALASSELVGVAETWRARAA
jgi:molecular chaperone IbpA